MRSACADRCTLPRARGRFSGARASGALPRLSAEHEAEQCELSWQRARTRAAAATTPDGVSRALRTAIERRAAIDGAAIECAAINGRLSRAAEREKEQL